MPKPPSPFAGAKLTEQTPLTGGGLDQRLFSSSPPETPDTTKENRKTVDPHNRTDGLKEVRKPVSEDSRAQGQLPTQEPVQEAAELDTQNQGQEFVGTDRHPAVNEPGFIESLAARSIRHFTNEEATRKATVLFTPGEHEALEELKSRLRREFQVKTHKNEIIRLAVHLLAQDFVKSPRASFLTRRLRKGR